MNKKEKEIKALIALLKDEKLPRKLNVISKHFMGAKFLANPVGDGQNSSIDKRSIFNYDFFDCQTYIETVMALARATDYTSFKKNVIDLRYRCSKTGFFYRNHFIHTQWVPNNIRKGLIQEVEATIDPKRKFIVKQNVLAHYPEQLAYYLRVAPEINELISHFSSFLYSGNNKELNLDLLPMAALIADGSDDGILRSINEPLIRKIPDCSIITFYFKDHEHLGIVHWEDANLYIRHARIKYGVVEDQFKNYLLYLHTFSNCIGLKIYSLI